MAGTVLATAAPVAVATGVTPTPAAVVVAAALPTVTPNNGVSEPSTHESDSAVGKVIVVVLVVAAISLLGALCWWRLRQQRLHRPPPQVSSKYKRRRSAANGDKGSQSEGIGTGGDAPGGQVSSRERRTKA